jgi:hypothetical protein
MGLFDFIPTLPEVMSLGVCLTIGHIYENGRCVNCKKKKP